MFDICITARTRLYVKYVYQYVPDYVWRMHNGTYQIICETRVPDHVWSMRDSTFRIMCEACVPVRTTLCLRYAWRYVPDYVWSRHSVTSQKAWIFMSLMSDWTFQGRLHILTWNFRPPAFREGRIWYWQTEFCVNINLKDFMFAIDDCIYVQYGHESWVRSTCRGSERCTLNFVCETWNESRNLKI